MKKLYLLLLFHMLHFAAKAEDGYETWLRYKQISGGPLLEEYKNQIHTIVVGTEKHETINIAVQEIRNGLSGMLGISLATSASTESGSILIGTNKHPSINILKFDLTQLHSEGFLIRTLRKGNTTFTVITANTEIGVLYGTFHFLRLIQTQQSIAHLNIHENPKIQHRLLNHWDNLNGSVERGYAGQSIWRWHELPEVISPRYTDYARYNASIGINGTVLTNVNANADILTTEYLNKVKTLADAFRPYGIKVYLTARFNAPVELDSLDTADPLDEKVIAWWVAKVKQIYTYIPDFGGFLVKANSEGQPGPREYGRTHAEGANLLAGALKPYHGIVMWRAFVYSNEVPEDRAKQAYSEFLPLDGKFEENVLVQTKNGPIDFQPREPFHPMFGAMRKTPLMMEFQITQEYLGQGMHLCYLAPLYKECLDADTYARGKGSYVSKAIDGRLHENTLTGMAGVSNIGSDRNWTGHLFGQSNWYAFGRLAWNHELTSEEIAEEWVKMTFMTDRETVKTIAEMMLISREAEVNFTGPLGLHHQMAWHHHYGPGPWIKDKPRTDWTSVYYHKADAIGVGFDRTTKGSNAVSQYFPEVCKEFNQLNQCPEKYLLWFHHVPWDHQMASGRTLWEELCCHYDLGVTQVIEMQKKWEGLEGKIDIERFRQVQALLKIQLESAKQWRDSCVLYFQTISKKNLPDGFAKPEKRLEEYMKMEFR
jgi:alpha-glucuronidase